MVKVLVEKKVTPLRPTTDHRRMVLWGWLAVAATFGVFLAWAVLADLARGAHVVGEVAVASGRKQIQHLEGGIVKAIHVTEGQWVSEGDLLISLDDRKARTDYQILRARWIRENLLEARLMAEYAEADRYAFPERLAGIAETALARRIYEDQKHLFEDRRRELKHQLDILEEKIGQLRYQIQGMRAQQRANRRQYALITEELGGLRQLAEKGIVPLTRVQAMEREQARLEGEFAARKAEIARTRVAISETELEIVKVRQSMRRQVATHLEQSRARIAELEEQLAEAGERLERTRIRAPITGQVIHLTVHTIGAVIKAGQPLMDIVPKDEPLIVEARVNPKDADVVHEGLPAELRFSSLPRRLAPLLHGEVVSFAKDVTVDAKGLSYYLARIQVPEEEMDKLRGLTVLPGMPVEVMIVAGHRTPLDYLITPVKQIFERAMRED